MSSGGIQVQWLGAASFRLIYKDTQILLDPYISRNPYAEKIPAVSLAELADKAEHALISHGHFDHVADVPALQIHNPILRIFGPETAMQTIRRYGGQGSGLNQGRIKISDEITADALTSKHVNFDLKLIVSTAFRAMFSKSSISHLRLSLLSKYPCGETVSYIISFKDRARPTVPFRIHFLGSAGPTNEMLESWARVHRRVDCLLVPLQGNSKICQIGANIVSKLRPRYVIPHHHDDYYPPISQHVDISEFKRLVAEKCPETSIIELELGATHTFDLISADIKKESHAQL